MTRADRRLFLRMCIATGLAVAGLWAVGAAFLWLHPTEPKTAHCLAKPMTEFRRCMWEAR